MLLATQPPIVARTTTLGALYPHPPLYLGIDSSTIPAWVESKSFQDGREWLASEFGAQSSEYDLFNTLVSLAKSNASPLHPITYAGGMIFGDGSVLTAAQQKLNEYGFSTDPFAICCSMARAKTPINGNPKQATGCRVMMVDQFGILHPPFAVGRSHLTEQGWGQARVFFHKPNRKIEQARVSDLVPCYADVTSGLEAVSKL